MDPAARLPVVRLGPAPWWRRGRRVGPGAVLWGGVPGPARAPAWNAPSLWPGTALRPGERLSRRGRRRASSGSRRPGSWRAQRSTTCDQDRRHVVRAAGLVGGVDEQLVGPQDLAPLLAEDLGHLLVGDHPEEAVAAEEEDVSLPDLDEAQTSTSTVVPHPQRPGR